MFTGIIKCVAKVTAIEIGNANKQKNKEKKTDGGKTFTILSKELPVAKLGESRAIDGVCTTVIASPSKNLFKFYASAETLSISTLKHLQVGMPVNVELPLKIGATLDGHIVSGHVDKTVVLTKKVPGESYILRFALAKADLPYVIEKGSVTLAGISLTVFKIISNAREHALEVMIIPHTYQQTTLQYLECGNSINIEFDLMGKYAVRYAMLNHKVSPKKHPALFGKKTKRS